MPLKWKRGSNPYVHNAFGTLQVGPATPDGRLNAVAQKRRARAGAASEGAAARAGVHAVDEALKCLLDQATRAEEQLLAHPQTQVGGGDRRGRLSGDIRKAAYVGADTPALELRHAASLYAFTPRPSVDAVAWPELESLALCAPGDPDDLALDIVFDR